MRFVRQILVAVYALPVFSLLPQSAFSETIELVTYFPAGAAAGGGNQQADSLRVGAGYAALPVPADGMALVWDSLGIGIPVPGGGAAIIPAGALEVRGTPDAADRAVFMPGAGGTFRVGIGTAAPNEQLELTGNFRLPVTTVTGGVPTGGAVLLGPDRFLHRFGEGNTFLGRNAGNFTLGGIPPDGTNNTGIGESTLEALTTGRQNVAVGRGALSWTTTGVDNVGVGMAALRDNTSGAANVAIGPRAAARNGTGSNNVAIGQNALNSNVAGSNNVAIGQNALIAAANTTNNVAIGQNAMVENVAGNNNIGIGRTALERNTAGNNNVGIGQAALARNTTGGVNVAIGQSALLSNTTGIANVAVGFSSLRDNTTGANSVGIGPGALFSNTTGGNNVGIGPDALRSNTTGSSNVGIGMIALRDNTTGSRNVAIGWEALRENIDGWDNVGIGWAALRANNSSFNVAVGIFALAGNTGGNRNVAVGQGAGQLNQAGSGNVFIGSSAGRQELGSDTLYIDNSNTPTPLIFGRFDTDAVTVNGTFTATGLKNFEIQHPLLFGHKLVHSTLEGPEAAVFYRGESRLVEGRAEIRLPDYFEALTRKEGRTVHLTAQGPAPYLLSSEKVADGKVTVHGTKPDGTFYWEVKAVRADVGPLVVEKPEEQR